MRRLILLCCVTAALGVGLVQAASLRQLERWESQTTEWVAVDGSLYGRCFGGCCTWTGSGSPAGVVVAKNGCDVYRDTASRLEYRFTGTAGTTAGWFLVPGVNVTPTPTATATPTATLSATPTPTVTATP